MVFNIYLIVLSICFLCSLISFRLHYPYHLKVFSVFIGVTLLTELAADFAPALFNFSNNNPVYNVFRLFEFLFIGYYFKLIIPNKTVQGFLKISFIAYPLFWAYCVFFEYGIGEWLSLLGDVNGAYCILLSAVFCYRLYAGNELINLKHSAEFWIAISLLFFEAVSLPLMGMLHYLTEKHPVLAAHLIDWLNVLNIITYLVFSYAFLCRKNLTTAK